MTDLCNLRDRGHYADNVRCVGNGNEPGRRGDCTFQCSEIKRIIGMHSDNIEPDALPGKIPPW